MKSIFTIPKIAKYDDPSKPWFVYFRYNGKLFRYKYGINYIKNLREREYEATALRNALHQKLKEGWNPLLPELKIDNSNLTLIEAIEFSIDKKKENLSPKSLSGYKGTIKFIIHAIKELALENLEIVNVKRSHIKLIIEKAKEQRNWSNKAHNKHLNHLKAILSELIQWDIIEHNPAFNIKNLPVEETIANIPATIEQQRIIRDHLRDNHWEYYGFIITIFHTGIRPEEILHIKLGMINLSKSEIRLPPEITKTNIERVVPINLHLMEYFKSMNFGKLPDSYYLFGSYRVAGKGNIGKHKDFISGPTRLKRDTATKRWKKIVKDGLGINVNMYSNKHAGANAKILAGIDLDSLRELYGHTSKLMTRRYAKVVSEVHRRQIMEHSPAF